MTQILGSIDDALGRLLANFTWHLLANFFRYIMAFLIWHALFNICTNLLWHLGTGGMGGHYLHLVARGFPQRPCTLGHAVRLDAALANIFAILKNLLEASWFVLRSVSIFAFSFLNNITLVFFLLCKSLLTNHFVFIVAFFMESLCARFYWNSFCLSARI